VLALGWVVATILLLGGAAAAWYYRSKWQGASTLAAARAAESAVLRATVKSERAVRQAAEASRNEALREKWTARTESAKKVTTDEDAATAWDAAAARVRNH
jgi:hypothetical protein